MRTTRELISYGDRAKVINLWVVTSALIKLVLKHNCPVKIDHYYRKLVSCYNIIRCVKIRNAN